MNKYLCAVAVALALWTENAVAGDAIFGGKAFRQLIQPPGVSTMAEPTPGVKYNVVLLTASVPVSFSELKIKDGVASIGPKIGVGGGVSLVVGKAVYNGESKVTISPMFIIGATIETGAAQGTTNVEGRLGGSLFLGLGPIGISAGYDLLGRTTYFGLSARIDAFQLLEDAFIPFSVWK